ncbi:hypothetical protein COLO4_20163 [Corchorus olitorius]|uniref:Uncharacterized protein n=1 Tax=Corchorus olitorius TaxID=93759 RepID=A0A1R3J1B7_9ROSI|nr:hypothetical protein COLO4_20163 [Corchorus olitorius]
MKLVPWLVTITTLVLALETAEIVNGCIGSRGTDSGRVPTTPRDHDGGRDDDTSTNLAPPSPSGDNGGGSDGGDNGGSTIFAPPSPFMPCVGSFCLTPNYNNPNTRFGPSPCIGGFCPSTAAASSTISLAIILLCFIITCSFAFAFYL